FQPIQILGEPDQKLPPDQVQVLLHHVHLTASDHLASDPPLQATPNQAHTAPLASIVLRSILHPTAQQPNDIFQKFLSLDHFGHIHRLKLDHDRQKGLIWLASVTQI